MAMKLSREQTAVRDAEVARLWNDEGLSQKNIAIRLGIALGTACQICNRLRGKHLLVRRPPGGVRGAKAPTPRPLPEGHRYQQLAPGVRIVVPIEPDPVAGDAQDDGETLLERIAKIVAGTNSRACGYPLWPHGAKPDFHYCGKAKDDVLDKYCPEHMAVCYRGVPQVDYRAPRMRAGGHFSPAMLRATEGVDAE